MNDIDKTKEYITVNKLLERKNQFIEKAKLVHKDENLDYSKVEYINNKTNICIIDNDLDINGNKYGEYWITPSNFLKGRSHPLRRGDKIRKKRSSKVEDVIKRFKEVHKDENLDYSEVVYTNMHTKVKIIDNDLKDDGTEYGEYWQTPNSHLKGSMHPLKGMKKQNISITSNTKDFIIKAKQKHKDKNYSYDLVDYKNNRKKVKIVCEDGSNGVIHGEFMTSPDNFLQGKGCPKCGCINSKAEEEVSNYIQSLGVEIIRNDRKILNGLELDILIPSKNIAIEYNGLRWHTEEFGKDKHYHLNKTLDCKKQGINVIHIFEDEYLEHKEVVLNKIKHILGISEELSKIMGRKCKVEEIDTNTAMAFLNDYHIQGYGSSTLHLGAIYNNELVAVMSFKKESTKSLRWELTRFASNIHYVCQGIGGKLFKYFVNTYNPSEIKSFADRRWTLNEESNLYTKLGFELVDRLRPEYRYVVGTERKHKFGFRKQILHKKYGLPLNMTEREMVSELGFSKIWDCGLLKYVWKKHE